MKLAVNLGVIVAMALFASSCGGSAGLGIAGDLPPTAESSQVETTPTADSDPEPESEPTTSKPTVEPVTPVPDPTGLTEAQIIDAARDAFAASSSDLIAWDELEAVVFGDRVRLKLCGWTGDTVFDVVRTAEYQVVADDQGSATVNFLFDGNTPDKCLSQDLVKSAVALTNDYNLWWDRVRQDPATIAATETPGIMTSDALMVQQQLAESWAAQGVHWEGHSFPTDLPTNAVNEMLVRRYERDSEPILELLVCVEKDAAFGLYGADGALVNDFASDLPKQHVIRRYELVRQAGQWLFDGGVESGFNCNDGPLPWLEVINEWKPDPTPWQAVSNA